MSFDSLLNKTCVIQTLSESQDAAGQKIKTWTTTLSGVACRIDSYGGGENIAPSMVYEKATHQLYLRKPTSITLDVGTHRIYLDSVYYDVLLVKNMYGYGDLDHLELILEIVR